VLACLTVLGDTSFELTGTRGDDEDSTIGLGCTSNHVLDEVTVTRSVNDLESQSVRVSPSQIWFDRWEIRTVTMYLGVSNFQRAMSMVIPRSRSAFSLSSTHARKVEKKKHQ